MKQINLTQSKIDYVDDEDFDSLSKFQWFYHNKGYAARNIGESKNQDTLYMHHFIMGTKDNKELDHIDGNGCNNKKDNLRFVTHQQNLFNQKKKSGTTSSFKGVSWCRRSSKWLCQIMVNKRTKFLGYFTNPVKAASAYDSAAVKHFGEYARFNFPVSLLAVALQEKSVP